ncbi:hypothetical protein F5890DRAFT_1559755 [Lentinula detonsa]|uniref:Uncharacterized protein n=1 Tax=Lentinula detonsa TaxID=2804962 RepID=A0AA38ULF8_9AGAR|nr:hypothetical protein F5890DRAFT_1559755 [Lentinula detonsa]
MGSHPALASPIQPAKTPSSPMCNSTTSTTQMALFSQPPKMPSCIGLPTSAAKSNLKLSNSISPMSDLCTPTSTFPSLPPNHHSYSALSEASNVIMENETATQSNASLWPCSPGFCHSLNPAPSLATITLQPQPVQHMQASCALESSPLRKETGSALQSTSPKDASNSSPTSNPQWITIVIAAIPGHPTCAVAALKRLFGSSDPRCSTDWDPNLPLFRDNFELCKMPDMIKKSSPVTVFVVAQPRQPSQQAVQITKFNFSVAGAVTLTSFTSRWTR